MSTSSARQAEYPLEQDIVVARTFNAPREIVWAAWTVPERLRLWWGPKDFTAPACRIDFRVGGRYLFCMRSPEGQDYWSTGVYRQIVPLKKIVCTDSFADAKGKVIPASEYGMLGDWPQELLVTVSFEEEGGRTSMTLNHVGIPPEMADACRAGWNESFDKLAKSLQ